MDEERAYSILGRDHPLTGASSSAATCIGLSIQPAPTTCRRCVGGRICCDLSRCTWSHLVVLGHAGRRSCLAESQNNAEEAVPLLPSLFYFISVVFGHGDADAFAFLRLSCVSSSYSVLSLQTQTPDARVCVHYIILFLHLQKAECISYIHVLASGRVDCFS